MRKTLLATLATALTASFALAAAAPDNTARMEQVVQEYVKSGPFMGAVLVARGDKVVFGKAYGSANVQQKKPDTLDTRFRIGSVTKQFTAAAILLLEERGKLSTTDPVKKYYPEAPAAWDHITVAHLLTHTSGIPNFTGFADHAQFMLQPTTPEKLVARFRDKPLDFEPGAQMRYSNSGYALLGFIIEKASGTTYAKFVEGDIFKPLGMKNSGYETSVPPIPNLAQGYVPGAIGPEPAKPIDMTVPFAAGGLYSTVGDLLRWNQALFANKLISAASVTKMTTPAKNGYAFGIAIGNQFGQRIFQHNGGIDGFNSKLAYYPDEKLTIVALSNINGMGADNIVDKLGAVAHGETLVLPSERVEVPLPEDVLQQYVGTYELGPGFDMVMDVKDNRLTVSPTGQGTDVLFAEAKDKFFSRKVDASIEFLRDDSGAVTHMVLHQGGFNAKAPKKK